MISDGLVVPDFDIRRWGVDAVLALTCDFAAHGGRNEATAGLYIRKEGSGAQESEDRYDGALSDGLTGSLQGFFHLHRSS